MNETENTIVVGQEWIFVRSGYSNWHSPSYGEVKKVAKIHKNGNFTLEGSAQQYKPVGWIKDTAYPTGESSYVRTRICLHNDAMKQRIAAGKIRREHERRVQNVATLLAKKLQHAENVTAEQLAALEAVFPAEVEVTV